MNVSFTGYVCILKKYKSALLAYCSAFIITYSDKSEQICVVINIRQTFEGCRQT